MPYEYRYLLILLLFPLLQSCGGKEAARKPTNWNTDLTRLSKDPYSLYLTHKSIPLLFPGARTEMLGASEHLTNLGFRFRKHEGKSLLVIIGLGIQFNSGEIDSLISLVEQGHEVLLSANDIDPELLQKLRLKQTYTAFSGDDPLQAITLRNSSGQFVTYNCKRRQHPLHSSFEGQDTVNAPFYTLGTNDRGEPDCILYTIGNGRLLLHAAPVAFTNYFLLQGNNHEYLNNLFSYFPDHISHIYFTGFNYRRVDHSDWGVLWNNIATRYAILLAILVLIIFVIFEMKRRQKIIPVIPPVENSSVAFVETIGRLYYNKKNHTNLAEKMVQHFLDFVRSSYYLNTNQLDQEFVRHLAAKSGKDISAADALVQQIKEVQTGVKADDAFLYSLYNQIREFHNGK